MMTLASGPWLTGCSQMVSARGDGQDPQQRFRGIGVVLVCDAVPGVEKKGVEFYDDRHVVIYAKSTLSKKTREIMALGSIRVPLTVRVIWHDSSKIVGRKENPNLDTYDGNIIGDYTLPIASRIPNEVLQEVRAHGGDLRLKFRLKADGVLFGWDIERRPGHESYSREEIQRKNMYFPPGYLLTGGDFKEARPAHYIFEGGKFIALPFTIGTPISDSDQALLQKYDLKLMEGTILSNPPTPPNHRQIWEKGWYINNQGQRIEMD